MCLGLRNGVTNSFVSVPPLNLNTDSVTITMWVNFLNTPLLPSWTGLLMWRNASGDAAGFGFGGITNRDTSGNIVAELGYTWNTNSATTYNWNSHLFLEAQVWSFVALTVTPTNATIYLYYARDSYTNMLKAVNTTNHSVESFSGAYSAQTWIGSDPQGGIGGGRSFPGSISDVAVYKRAMQESEIQRLFLMALGNPAGVCPNIQVQPTIPPLVYAGQKFQLSCLAGGYPDPTYQWQMSDNSGGPWTNIAASARITGVTSNVLTVLHSVSSDAGYYQVVVANSGCQPIGGPLQVSLVPTPNNGQWTVNFCITDTDNGNDGLPFSGYGIFGNGTYWNPLSGPQFSSPASVKRDDGVTTSSISLTATNYPGHWASAAPYDNKLLDTYCQCDTNGTAFIFSGVPSGIYNLAVYGCCGSLANRGTIFTVKGVSQWLTNVQDTYFAPNDNTALFTNVIVTGGTLELDMRAILHVPAQKTTNSNEGDFNGVQIRCINFPPPPPPPPSFGFDGYEHYGDLVEWHAVGGDEHPWALVDEPGHLASTLPRPRT